MSISYKESKKCLSLFEFCSGETKVRDTSIESFKDLQDKDKQCKVVEKLLRQAEHGLTDFELRKLLREFRIDIPLSSVSARRNDLNRIHAELVSYSVVYGKSGERRRNPITGKLCQVWRWRG